MKHVMEFYEFDMKKGKQRVGLAVITKNGFDLVEADDSTRELLGDALQEVRDYQTGKILTPKDGDAYVQRLLGKFRGSRFWAELREDPKW